MNPALIHAYAEDRYEELLREAQRQRTLRARLAARQALLDRVHAERARRAGTGRRSAGRSSEGAAEAVRGGVRVAFARWVVRRLAPELLP